VLEGVLDADWSPDGKELAVIHVVGEHYRVEYPIGRVLYAPDPPTWMSGLRISGSGDQVVFTEHPVPGDMRGDVSVVGPRQPRRVVASGLSAVNGAMWSPSGREVWFAGARRSGVIEQVMAVTLSGRERSLVGVAGNMILHDVSRRGQLLMERTTEWTDIRARARDAAEEVELPAADLSFLSDLSDDGSLVLGTDVGQGGGPNAAFYLQKTDGSKPLWLGEGDGQALSPDGRLALALLLHARPQQLLVVPTGAGETRALEPGPVTSYSRAVWDPSGRRVLFAGRDAHDEERVYVQELSGGPPRAVTGVGVTLTPLGRPVAPDGRRVVAVGPDGVPALYPLEGGEPAALAGLDEDDLPVAWTPDGRELLVLRYSETELRVERVDVASGRARPWVGLGRALPSGYFGQKRLLITPDGRSYAYGYARRMSDLYVTSPLR
jgi:hypothetical protein